MTSELANLANTEYASAEKSAHDALTHAKQAGEALTRAKGDLPHGEWLAWLANHWDWDERTAQRLMRLSQGWEQLANTTRLSDLSVSDAMKLLQKPPKVDETPAKPSKSSEPTPEPPQPPASGTSAEAQQWRTERDEARQEAQQAQAELSAMRQANAGADAAAREIVGRDEQIAALKAQVAQLQEDVRRWRAKAKHWEKIANA